MGKFAVVNFDFKVIVKHPVSHTNWFRLDFKSNFFMIDGGPKFYT